MSTFEFGILEDWSTISLNPKYRVDMSYEEFILLDPAIDKLRKNYGLELAVYSCGEKIEGESLVCFLETMNSLKDNISNKPEIEEIVTGMLNVIKAAIEYEKPLIFNGE